MADLFEIISTRLSGDTIAGGVNEPIEGATGGFHRGKAPEKSTYPRVHVKVTLGLPIHTATKEVTRRNFVQFTTFAKDPQGLPGESAEPGGAKAARLNKRIQKLFFDSDEVVNDPAFNFCRLDRELPSDTERDAANGTDVFSEGCVLEMWTSE